MGSLAKHRSNFLDTIQRITSPVVTIDLNQSPSETNITEITTTNEEVIITKETLDKWFASESPGDKQQARRAQRIENKENRRRERENRRAEKEEVAPLAPPSPTESSSGPTNESPSSTNEPPSSSNGNNNEDSSTPRGLFNIPQNVFTKAELFADNIIYKDKGFSSQKWKEIANADKEQLKNYSNGEINLFVLIYRLAVQAEGGYSGAGSIEGIPRN